MTRCATAEVENIDLPTRFGIRATLNATSVPSIFPLSLVTRYSATQSAGPFPSEKFFVNWEK